PPDLAGCQGDRHDFRLHRTHLLDVEPDASRGAPPPGCCCCEIARVGDRYLYAIGSFEWAGDPLARGPRWPGKPQRRLSGVLLENLDLARLEAQSGALDKPERGRLRREPAAQPVVASLGDPQARQLRSLCSRKQIEKFRWESAAGEQERQRL